MNEPHRSQPLRFQFRLRTLFVCVTGCCLLFYTMRLIGPSASVALVFAILLVLMHVAGNAIGTSLRDQAEREIATSDKPVAQRRPTPAATASPRARMFDRTPLGWSIAVLTVLGATIGAAGGSWAYAYLVEATTAGVIVGGTSAGILGGFFTFVGSSFLLTCFRETIPLQSSRHSLRPVSRPCHPRRPQVSLHAEDEEFQQDYKI